MYAIRTAHGTLKQKYARSQFVPNQVTSLEISNVPDNEVNLREVARKESMGSSQGFRRKESMGNGQGCRRKESIGSGQGFRRCAYLKSCSQKSRCSCLAAGLLCNSKRQNSLSYKNNLFFLSVQC